VIIKKLFISNIRNLQPQEINTAHQTVFLLGKNGQGKTSVLEAVFLLSHLRSFRSTTLLDVININPTEELKKSPRLKNKEAFVRAILETNLGEVELAVSINGKKREFLLNGKKITSVEKFCGILKTVLFTPEDLEIVKGAPQIRRQFLDRILVMLDPKDIGILNDYSKKLKIRNHLLKQKDYKAANLFNNQLIQLNIEIVKKRVNLVNLLQLKIGDLYSEISGVENENFQLVYQSTFFNEVENDFRSLEECQQLFFEQEQRESILGRTALGCHKDELKIEFHHNDLRTNSRITSSQGQTRTKVLSFKLASAQIIHDITGKWPILLLDDVEAELDSDRSRNLRKRVFSYQGQVFITGTSLELDKNEKADYVEFVIEKGNIERKKDLEKSTFDEEQKPDLTP